MDGPSPSSPPGSVNPANSQNHHNSDLLTPQVRTQLRVSQDRSLND